MNPIAKYAIAAAAVVVIAVAGFSLLSPAAPSQIGGVASPSPEPSNSPAPLAPTSGAMEPGRYRWQWSDGQEVSFNVPEGWSGRAEGLTKKDNEPGEFQLFLWVSGKAFDVTHVYADACQYEGRLEPIGPTVDDLIGALDDQIGTNALPTTFSVGSVNGSRVSLHRTPELDPTTCLDGADGALQIWADPAGTGSFSWELEDSGVVYAFDVGGERVVFTGAFDVEASEADVEEVDAIVRSMTFTRH